MKRITTSLGTEYLYDDVNGRIKRRSNIRPITLVGGEGPADDRWDILLSLNPSPLKVGSPMKMVLYNGDWRQSTMVTKIEDVEADYIVTNEHPALAGQNPKVLAERVEDE